MVLRAWCRTLVHATLFCGFAVPSQHCCHNLPVVLLYHLSVAATTYQWFCCTISALLPQPTSGFVVPSQHCCHNLPVVLLYHLSVAATTYQWFCCTISALLPQPTSGFVVPSQHCCHNLPVVLLYHLSVAATTYQWFCCTISVLLPQPTSGFVVPSQHCCHNLPDQRRWGQVAGRQCRPQPPCCPPVCRGWWHPMTHTPPSSAALPRWRSGCYLRYNATAVRMG